MAYSGVLFSSLAAGAFDGNEATYCLDKSSAGLMRLRLIARTPTTRSFRNSSKDVDGRTQQIRALSQSRKPFAINL